MTKISELLDRGIAIIDREITWLELQEDQLDRSNADKLTELLRCLIAIDGDRRKVKDRSTETMSDADIEAAILEEAAAIKRRKERAI